MRGGCRGSPRVGNFTTLARKRQLDAELEASLDLDAIGNFDVCTYYLDRFWQRRESTADKIASVCCMQSLFEPSLPMLKTVELQKGYNQFVFQKLRQNSRYSSPVARQASTCDDPSVNRAHRCDHTEEVVQSACVFAFDSEYSPAPTAMEVVLKVHTMFQSGLPENGKTFNFSKARCAFARKVRGQGFSKDARL